MPNQTRIVRPGPAPGTVLTAEGQVLRTPADWERLPPGDAALTRRVKQAGPTWTVEERRGRRAFSRGVWAAATTIAAARSAVIASRAAPGYDRRRQAATHRRAQHHLEYVEEFRRAVLAFLAFAPGYADLAARLADAVATHATPVGSRTVARTQRIPVAERAAAATVAWLRHQTTAYDHMPIARVKGRRRQVRRALAAHSRALLDAYRRGEAVDPATCPLAQALARTATSPAPPPPTRPAPAVPAPPPPPASPSPAPGPKAGPPSLPATLRHLTARLPAQARLRPGRLRLDPDSFFVE